MRIILLLIIMISVGCVSKRGEVICTYPVVNEYGISGYKTSVKVGGRVYPFVGKLGERGDIITIVDRRYDY